MPLRPTRRRPFERPQQQAGSLRFSATASESICRQRRRAACREEPKHMARDLAQGFDVSRIHASPDHFCARLPHRPGTRGCCTPRGRHHRVDVPQMGLICSGKRSTREDDLEVREIALQPVDVVVLQRRDLAVLLGAESLRTALRAWTMKVLRRPAPPCRRNRAEGYPRPCRAHAGLTSPEATLRPDSETHSATNAGSAIRQAPNARADLSLGSRC